MSKKRDIYGPLAREDYTELETDDSGRKVLSVDSGLYAGAYQSVPAEEFASYANTFKVPDTTVGSARGQAQRESHPDEFT